MNSIAKFRVLVVEDEVLLRLDLVAHLENFGNEVVEAGTAAEAIDILERDRSIRVVFTDIRMPGEMDGVALALSRVCGSTQLPLWLSVTALQNSGARVTN